MKCVIGMKHLQNYVSEAVKTNGPQRIKPFFGFKTILYILFITHTIEKDTLSTNISLKKDLLVELNNYRKLTFLARHLTIVIKERQ